MNILKKLSFLTVLSVFLLQAVNSQELHIPSNLDFSNIKLFSGNEDIPPYNVSRTDFTIPLSDGVMIDAVKFIPAGATPPSGGWPVIIMVHGYGNNKETLAGFCQSQAAWGYYTMTFSMRGQGNSTGLSNLISRTEAQDFIQIVNRIKGDAVSGANPNKILVTGGSQGGLIPFMAACLGLNVRTIVSSLAPPDFASNWIENGSVKMTFLWSVSYGSGIARYTPQVNKFKTWVYANNKQMWDSLAYWVPKDRDFMPLVPNCKVPLIMEGSWQDKFFNGSGIIQAASLMTVPFRMYMGAVPGHGGDPSATEDQWHSSFINDWYFYWLFNVQNGVLNREKYEYASTTHPVNYKYWTFTHSKSAVWPPANTSNYRLHFNAGRELKTQPNINTWDHENVVNYVINGLTMQEAVNYQFTGSTFNSKFTKRTIEFNSQPLTNDMKMAGIPKIHLRYSSDGIPFCQFNFQIYEVRPDGTQKLINRINYTDRNYPTAYSIRTATINGQAHSHVFKTGSKIRVTATNLDTSPDDAWFLGTNPFVLPNIIRCNNFIFMNDTYIDLPVINASMDITSDITSSVEENKYDAAKFKLEQNYPNPFNPSTSINFTLAKDGYVTLKIYDIAGREIKTLVNENMNSGSHAVRFDAGILASGVYFYKLVSGSFTEIKRMILVK